jgi:hypothetical protein
MGSNPLKITVEVEFRPQYVGDLCFLIFLRLGLPFGEYVRHIRARPRRGTEVRL